MKYQESLSFSEGHEAKTIFIKMLHGGSQGYPREESTWNGGDWVLVSMQKRIQE